MINRILTYLLILGAAGIIYSCSDPVTGDVGNQAPQTYLSLFPDSVIAPGSTLKKVSWWGDDPDGFVSAFRISFDSVNWTVTTKNDSTFLFVINGNDSTFHLYVAAVDNKGLIDPTPASNLYPVINTPPSMVFDGGTEIPDTTFPVATFKWTGTDPDGNNTVKSYYWALNDTTNFRQISGSINSMTLTKDSGLALNSQNKLYMKAQDNAGAFSPTVTMPDSGGWYVKAVTARVLLIKDMPVSNMGAAAPYFQSAFDTVRYDVLDIKSNNGALIPKIVNPMFIETLKLFKVVVWSANRGASSADNANFSLAQNSLPFYLQSGGKVFFSTGFPDAETQGQGQIINFAPIDSITSCTVPFLSSNTPLITSDNTYPDIFVSSNAGLNIQRVRGLFPQVSAKIVYRISNTTSCQTNTIVCIKDSDVNSKVVLMSLPVYYLDNGSGDPKDLFKRILFGEFGL